MTMGTRMATAAVSADGLAKRSGAPPAALSWAEISPKAKKPPKMNQAIEATSATMKGEREGLCCSAKIKPPIDGKSSLAAVAIRRWAGPAGRLIRVTGLPALPPEAAELTTSVSSSGLVSSSLKSCLKSCGLASAP